MTVNAEIAAALADIGRGPDHGIALAEAALLLARKRRPGLRPNPYLRHFDKLARETAAFVRSMRPRGEADEATPQDVAEALEHVLARRYGYCGDAQTYDELENADIARVIDRRQGLPVSLAILYIHAGRATGATVDAIDFPGHVLVRIEAGGQRVIVDPFIGGKTVDAVQLRALHKALSGLDSELVPAHWRQLCDRGVLVRLQNNIKSRLLEAGQMEDALSVVETMLAIAPDDAVSWRDAGLLRAKLVRIEGAVAAREEYLRRAGGDEQRYRVGVLLQELRARLG